MKDKEYNIYGITNGYVVELTYRDEESNRYNDHKTFFDNWADVAEFIEENPINLKD